MPPAPYYRTAPPSRRPLMTRRQAAHLLGVTVFCMEKWAERQTGPAFYRMGFATRSRSAYRIEDLETFAIERGVEFVGCVGSRS